MAGHYYYDVAKNMDKAFSCYTRAANMGDAIGQVFVGTCFTEGSGVAKDEKQAFKHYKLT